MIIRFKTEGKYYYTYVKENGKTVGDALELGSMVTQATLPHWEDKIKRRLGCPIDFSIRDATEQEIDLYFSTVKS